ncbi:methyl-accepting chemotaxis protein [Haloarcula marina]|uniref:methyl-accepting chemotaxis protein n=1 Tax=Haloarcula marina TaxID=2961574 RepID=UPI0020B7EF64|nr:methyl-accepting chemotaxis protein [Halomicroarcula marina]
MSSPDTGSGNATLTPERQDDTDEAEQLRAERDHWRHLFDQLVAQFPEPVIVVEDSGRLTHWNEEQAEFIGTPRADALGRPAHEIVGTEAVTETLAEQVARTGEAVRETDIRSGTHDDGSDWHVRATAVPLVAPTGDVVGCFEYVSRVTDLVEQRESMQQVQQKVSEELETSVTDLNSASEQVTRNAEEIADIAEEEAEHIDDVDEEIQALSATTEEVASSVETISAQTDDAEILAADSETATGDLLETVESVTDASEQMASDATELADQIAEIDDVVTTIDDLAKQINMLALNASIEAARAGEAGEGFAVVADEVKNLAAESQAEADRIERLIRSVSEIAATTIDSVEVTTEMVADIEAKIQTVNENQRQIQTSIADVSTQLHQIAAATDDQATSAEEIAALLDTTVEGVKRVADEIAELAVANQRQTQQIAQIRASVDSLERNLNEVVDTD